MSAWCDHLNIGGVALNQGVVYRDYLAFRDEVPSCWYIGIAPVLSMRFVGSYQDLDMANHRICFYYPGL